LTCRLVDSRLVDYNYWGLPGRFGSRLNETASEVRDVDEIAAGHRANEGEEMGRFTNQVVVITGGGRGQGRSHAVAFAREGADVVFCDIVTPFESVAYPHTTAEDMDVTERLVTALGRRCVKLNADVRSTSDMELLVKSAVAEFGRIDVLICNAGISSMGPLVEITDQAWDDSIGVDLTGVFKCIRAVAPEMISRGYGRIIATASIMGKQGMTNLAAYCAAKWGVIGLVKSAALELGPYGVTVNAVCPTNVDTLMGAAGHPDGPKYFRPDLENPTVDDMKVVLASMHAVPIPWVESSDVSRAMLFLAEEESKYITGNAFDIAAGWNAKYTA
jgi:SDR family mycofactocin-dependent oxidoreductase